MTSRALKNRAKRSGTEPAKFYNSGVGHADYRLWVEKYGWEPDPYRKALDVRRNKVKKFKAKKERLQNGLVRRKHLRLCPIAAEKASALCTRAKKRARFLKLPFDLDGDWVLEKILDGACEATGIKFEIYRDVNDTHWQGNMFAPSLDQIKPGGGYTKDSIQVVCWCYNAAKSTGTDADVLRMAEALVARSKSGKYEG